MIFLTKSLNIDCNFVGDGRRKYKTISPGGNSVA